jgi:hypothetical protein
MNGLLGRHTRRQPDRRQGLAPNFSCRVRNRGPLHPSRLHPQRPHPLGAPPPGRYRSTTSSSARSVRPIADGEPILPHSANPHRMGFSGTTDHLLAKRETRLGRSAIASRILPKCKLTFTAWPVAGKERLTRRADKQLPSAGEGAQLFGA